MSGREQQQYDLMLIKELEIILDSCTLGLTAVDEVWPNLFIGNIAVAQNKRTLSKLGITHILNAAHSKQGSIGDQSFYGNACVYCGVPGEDSDHFDLSQYFKSAADFIHKGLKCDHGAEAFAIQQSVFVCCVHSAAPPTQTINITHLITAAAYKSDG
ncbi:dual specificity protein phosphatase 13A-like isoform X2 [Nerophis ophidion]|uniref:dual specificity protein phosphatase 13A-like isoform X2 n=1 Tax=Nerophis ophidion TaxID=159077 RepID=UPI002ADF9AAB|nr:dual specificity protein phosphatase 13A-like isoform X2 [Nerophis ophidion]